MSLSRRFFERIYSTDKHQNSEAGRQSMPTCWQEGKERKGVSGKAEGGRLYAPHGVRRPSSSSSSFSPFPFSSSPCCSSFSCYYCRYPCSSLFGFSSHHFVAVVFVTYTRTHEPSCPPSLLLSINPLPKLQQIFQVLRRVLDGPSPLRSCCFTLSPFPLLLLPQGQAGPVENGGRHGNGLGIRRALERRPGKRARRGGWCSCPCCCCRCLRQRWCHAGIVPPCFPPPPPCLFPWSFTPLRRREPLLLLLFPPPPPPALPTPPLASSTPPPPPPPPPPPKSIPFKAASLE